jgi:hypothetical protein
MNTKKAQLKRTVRRSFALPSQLIEEALRFGAKEDRMNLNRLVTIALQDYVDRRKRREFEKSMLEMGSDEEVLRECAAINKQFAQTERDGLAENK